MGKVDHAHQLNPEFNQACRAITGCLKPTNIENLYLLAGIAPPEIRRSVCARVERTKQAERETHSLFGHTPARSRLKSRRSFLTSVQSVHFPAKVVISNSDHITLNTNTPTRVPITTLQQTSSPDISTVSNTLYNRTSWTTQHALSSPQLTYDMTTDYNKTDGHSLTTRKRTGHNSLRPRYPPIYTLPT